SMRRMYSQIGATTSASTTTTNSSGSIVYSTNVTTRTGSRWSVMLNSGTAAEQLVTVLVAALAAAASTAGNLIALCWFGMWMGMASRSPKPATLKTILLFPVIPMLVIFFASSILLAAVMAPFFYKPPRSGAAPSSVSWMTWYPLVGAVVSAFLALGKDAAFILWSRKRIYNSFREQAAQTLGQPRFTAPPALRQMSVPPLPALR